MLRARTHHTTILIMRATIDHIAVVRVDLERSLHFLRDLLGFEMVSPEGHDGGPLDRMANIDGLLELNEIGTGRQDELSYDWDQARS